MPAVWEACEEAGRRHERASHARSGDGGVVLPNPAVSPVVSATPIPSAPPKMSSGAGGDYPSDLDQQIIKAEGSKPDSVSPKGAIGVNQIMPETAARYGVSREQLFDPAINEQLGQKIRRDLWQKYRDPVAVKVAYNAGEAVADRWLASGRNNAALPAETQRYIDPAHLANMLSSSVGAGAARERMAAFDRDIAEQSSRDRAEYERLANQKDPGAKERGELLDEARQRARHYREVYEDFAKSPPPEKPIDALSNFGSIGTILALLIGGMGRHHLNGALAAAGSMMQAAQANNHEQFERQFKIWDHQTNMALNLSRLEGEEVRGLLEDKRMAENDKQARLHAFYEEHNMTWQAMQMRAGMLERVMQAEEARQRAQEGVANQKYQFSQMMFQSWRAAHPNATEDEISQQAKFFGVIPPGGAATGGLWSKDSMDALVEMAVRGDPGVMTSLPRSGPARKQFEEAFAAKLKAMEGGISGGAAQVVFNRLRMAEAKAAATTAGRVTMQTELYAQEAEGAGKLLVDASKAFPRTEYPRVNQAIAAYEKGTGDPHIIQFGTAINALMNAYGKLSNPTGTGIHDADKERLAQILDTSLSKGQIEAGVEQIIREGRNVSQAAQQAQIGVLSGLTPKGTEGSSQPPLQSPLAPAVQSLPVPQAFQGDPDGTGYKKDGKMWVKKGDQLILTPGATETPR